LAQAVDLKVCATSCSSRQAYLDALVYKMFSMACRLAMSLLAPWFAAGYRFQWKDAILSLDTWPKQTRWLSRSQESRSSWGNEVKMWEFQLAASNFRDAFKSNCVAQGAKLMVKNAPAEGLDVTEVEDYPQNWNTDKFLEGSNDTFVRRTGCSKDKRQNVGVCHVVLRLQVGSATAWMIGRTYLDPIGQNLRQATEFKLVGDSDFKLVGDTIRSSDGSFKATTDNVSLLDWNCVKPEAPAEQATLVVGANGDPQQTHDEPNDKVVMNMTQNSEPAYPYRCCCAKVDQSVYAVHVKLVDPGNKEASSVGLAVGHSGWYSGTPEHSHCPIISTEQPASRAEVAKTVCACTTQLGSWKAGSKCGGVLGSLPPNRQTVETHQFSSATWSSEEALQCTESCAEPAAIVDQECSN